MHAEFDPRSRHRNRGLARLSMATSATKDDERVTKRVDYCCVPHCNGNGRLHKDLSFHRIPSEKKVELRKRWIIAIRRDEGPDFKVQ